MSVKDRINVDERSRTISVVLPDGWTIRVIANDLQQDLETGYVSGVPGKRTRVCVTPRRDEFRSAKADGRPKWSCERYGSHEHDWMDCPECVEGYEKSMETES